MSVIINNFSIINNSSDLAINVETNLGFQISNINLWKMNEFKDYSLATNLNYKLEQISNQEIFIVSASELNILKFEDVLFIEITSTFKEEDPDCSNCQTPALGITYDLSNYHQCLLSYFLESDIGTCVDCGNKSNNDIVITISLLIEMVENAIEIGYYIQAIDMIKKLKKLCAIKQCKNCKPLNCSSCNKFKQY